MLAAPLTAPHSLPATAAPAAPAVFDVCHVGVVLRVLLAAHVLLGVGLLFVTRDMAAWFGALAAGSAMVLPAALLWLLASCALKRPLARAPRLAQALAATLLGALGGAAGWALGSLGLLGGGDAGPVAAVPAAAAGALAGFATFHWLALRAQAQLPADTTARLAELQSRIRPHFLFNTLNTALSLVRLDPARAEGVLEDLAELFRAALADDVQGNRAQGDGSVTLAAEVELARRYLAIEQIRFGTRLQVAWELDPDAAGARVPPLLLQPLVENAVRHGVEPVDAGGTIRVRTRVKLGRALITISNSVGSAASTPGHGIALRNVRERLRLMHDVAAQLDVQREPGLFRVQVTVPL